MTNDPIALDDDSLTKLDPAHIPASRIAAAITILIPIIGAIMIEFMRILPMGAIIIPVLIIAGYWVMVVPVRKYARWGYHMGSDRIRIVRGYLFYSDTIVPFSRVQHIDVEQGPIQRPYGLATLTLHTAGNHNSTVSLPGLLHSDALILRDTIRSHIRRDMI
jgi:uncharacterized protein